MPSWNKGVNHDIRTHDSAILSLEEQILTLGNTVVVNKYQNYFVYIGRRYPNPNPLLKQ